MSDRDYNGVELKNGDVVTFQANVKQAYGDGRAFFEIDKGPNFTCDTSLCQLATAPKEKEESEEGKPQKTKGEVSPEPKQRPAFSGNTPSKDFGGGQGN